LCRLQIVELSLEIADFGLVLLLDTSDFSLVVLLGISDFALQLFDLFVHRCRCLRQGRYWQDGPSQTDRQRESIS
jgi:hypothetical protein